MNRNNCPITVSAKILCVSVLVFLAAGMPAPALRITKMPKEYETTNPAPELRTIALKLPLRQAVFHWTFMSRAELLKGKLLLRITRNGQTNELVVFQGGKMGEAWEAMALPNPKAGEIYFGFKSLKKHATAPGDRLELELQATQDLNGVGPTEKGVLPAGTYKAHGTYAGLIDEYPISDRLKEAPKDTIRKLHEAYDFTAFLENWQEEWDLRITSQEGWLPAASAQGYKEMLGKMAKEDGAAK